MTVIFGLSVEAKFVNHYLYIKSDRIKEPSYGECHFFMPLAHEIKVRDIEAYQREYLENGEGED